MLRRKTPLLFIAAGALTASTVAFVYLHSQWLIWGRARKTVANPQEEELEVPEDAPDECPGLGSAEAGKAEACSGCPNQQICASGAKPEDDGSSEKVRQRLQGIRKKVLVLSGKGGVGKSTVSSQLAWTLQARGFRVGLLDIDICGPSIPRMTGCLGADVRSSEDGWSPVYVTPNLGVMSIAFMLADEDAAIIWRGPKKNGLIKQFLSDVSWGEADFLLIDTPPGTSDEHLSAVSYLSKAGVDGVIIVTTPQEVALQDVRKQINFCKKLDIKVIGVVENMHGSVFAGATGGAEAMCKKMSVPHIGSIPLDRELLLACENGKCLVETAPASASAVALNLITDKLLIENDFPAAAFDAEDSRKTAGVIQVDN